MIKVCHFLWHLQSEMVDHQFLVRASLKDGAALCARVVAVVIVTVVVEDRLPHFPPIQHGFSSDHYTSVSCRVPNQHRFSSDLVSVCCMGVLIQHGFPPNGFSGVLCGGSNSAHSLQTITPVLWAIVSFLIAIFFHLRSSTLCNKRFWHPFTDVASYLSWVISICEFSDTCGWRLRTTQMQFKVFCMCHKFLPFPSKNFLTWWFQGKANACQIKPQGTCSSRVAEVLQHLSCEVECARERKGQKSATS